VDPILVGNQMLSYWQNATEKLLNGRELIPKGQMIDLQFNHLIDDPIKIANQIFEKFSIKHDEAFERKLTTRIGTKKLKSKHSYSYEKFFRASGEVENKFVNYISYFDL
tara:strand:+ start:88 stop:414 length:327 start_codon:yes stop_codon:yes gene_type:complete